MKTAAQTTSRSNRHRWSDRVTRTSHAMNLESGVFTKRDPKKIAASVKRSSVRSRTRKADPYRSVSMISFYENRAGRNLSTAQRRKLQRAKRELKRQFGRG